MAGEQQWTGRWGRGPGEGGQGGGAGSCAQGPQEGREGLKRGSATLHVRLKKMGLPALWLSWDSQLEGNSLLSSQK